MSVQACDNLRRYIARAMLPTMVWRGPVCIFTGRVATLSLRHDHACLLAEVQVYPSGEQEPDGTIRNLRVITRIPHAMNSRVVAWESLFSILRAAHLIPFLSSCPQTHSEKARCDGSCPILRPSQRLLYSCTGFPRKLFSTGVDDRQRVYGSVDGNATADRGARDTYRVARENSWLVGRLTVSRSNDLDSGRGHLQDLLLETNCVESTSFISGPLQPSRARACALGAYSRGHG
jgi:hypothetical protein